MCQVLKASSLSMLLSLYVFHFSCTARPVLEGQQRKRLEMWSLRADNLCIDIQLFQKCGH